MFRRLLSLTLLLLLAAAPAFAQDRVTRLEARLTQLEARQAAMEAILQSGGGGRFGFGIIPIQAPQQIGVNHLRFLSGATAVDPSIVAYGVDTNIGLTITLKGSGTLNGTFALNATPASQSAATTTSFQAVAGDFAVTGAWGSSTAGTPTYGAGVMGNIIGAAALTGTQNILAGVYGKWDVPFAISTTYPGAAVTGEIGDNATSASYAVMAAMGGDSAGTESAVAAFGVDWFSSTVASRFNFGIDFQGAGTHDSYLAPRYNIAFGRVGGRTFDSNEATVFTAANICWPAVTNSAPVDGTSGTRAGTCGPGSILIRMDNGTIFQNTNTLASPTWTAR